MAITFTTSVAGNSSTNVASLALPSISVTSGQKVVITIALGSTSSSISSITDSGSRLSSLALQKAKNGTGVRTEIWTGSVGSTGSTTITINITGGNTTIAAVCGEYAGISSFGNTGDGSGNDRFPNVSIATQDTNNFVATALGFACQSGDTFTATNGTSRNSSIPAATAVGCALYDTTSLVQCTPLIESRLNTTRQWAAAGLELRSGLGNVIPVLCTPVPALWATVPAANSGFVG
jgi:hypothetical protein